MMQGNDFAQARKQYVEEVRRSFHHTEPDEYGEMPQEGTASFFKVRFFLAVFIFAAFVLCDRTESRFYNFTTKEIVAMLQEERFQSQLASIRAAWSSLTKSE